MTVLAAALLALTAASWGYWALALALVRRHLRAAAPASPPALPPASLLKPLRGLDHGARESLESFFRLDYPGVELLFGVADPDDPVIPLVERLRAEHPRVAARLLVAPAPGPNRKASLLDALARAARFDVLVATDGDMRVRPGWLREVVSALSAPGAGLVTCPYVGIEPRSLAARLEALHMGTTFLPSAILASRGLGIAFAMGATMALRREDLRRAGGFAPLAEFLADDFQLGARVAALGLRVVVSREVVATVLGRTTLREGWDREVRWARCARVSRPAGHLGYVATFSLPLALAALAASGLSTAGWLALAGSLAVRWLAAGAVARATGDAASLRALPLLPLRDLLTAAIWGAALAGRTVTWRGERLEVDRTGRLRRPRAATGGEAPAPPAARATAPPGAR